MAGISGQPDRVVVGIEDLEHASSVRSDVMAKKPSARESARGGGAGSEPGSTRRLVDEVLAGLVKGRWHVFLRCCVERARSLVGAGRRCWPPARANRGRIGQ
jgi:hypothetical protein